MKTPNTPEEKAKFFAQYWGQDVLSSDMYGDYGTIYSLTMKVQSFDNQWLSLTPLKNISDEDAIEVARVQSWRRGFEQDVHNFKHTVILMGEGSLGMPYEIADFLRSRSYLLPYKDLSTEDLIAYGWAKEREL